MYGEINIKVIIHDGIVDAVLCDDTRFPISIEIVDVNKSYPDYSKLSDYADRLCRSEYFKEILPIWANFTEE